MLNKSQRGFILYLLVKVQIYLQENQPKFFFKKMLASEFLYISYANSIHKGCVF